MPANDMGRQVEAEDAHILPPVRGHGSYTRGRSVPTCLPLRGEALSPRVVPQDWLTDLQDPFVVVQRLPREGQIQEHPGGRQACPHKTWLLQFQVQKGSLFKHAITFNHSSMSIIIVTDNLNILV
jgi:hypothetical protein